MASNLVRGVIGGDGGGGAPIDTGAIITKIEHIDLPITLTNIPGTRFVVNPGETGAIRVPAGTSLSIGDTFVVDATRSSNYIQMILEDENFQFATNGVRLTILILSPNTITYFRIDVEEGTTIFLTSFVNASQEKVPFLSALQAASTETAETTFTPMEKTQVVNIPLDNPFVGLGSFNVVNPTTDTILLLRNDGATAQLSRVFFSGFFKIGTADSNFVFEIQRIPRDSSIRTPASFSAPLTTDYTYLSRHAVLQLTGATTDITIAAKTSLDIGDDETVVMSAQNVRVDITPA